MFVGTSTEKGTKSEIKKISPSILKQLRWKGFVYKVWKRTDGLKMGSKFCKIFPSMVSARKNRWTRNDVYELLHQRQTFPWRLIATKVEYAQVLCWSCTFLSLQYKHSQVYWKELILLVHCARGQMQNCPKCRSNASPHSQKSPIDIINPVSLVIR